MVAARCEVGLGMVGKRRSAVATRAREKAREAAAAAVAREERLLKSAEGFFAETLDVEDERERIRARISELQSQLAALDAPAPAAARFVGQMKDEGLQNKDIADRLELTPGEVTRYLRLAREDATAVPAAASSPESEESALVSGDPA